MIVSISKYFSDVYLYKSLGWFDCSSLVVQRMLGLYQLFNTNKKEPIKAPFSFTFRQG